MLQRDDGFLRIKTVFATKRFSIALRMNLERQRTPNILDMLDVVLCIPILFERKYRYQQVDILFDRADPILSPRPQLRRYVIDDLEPEST